MSDNSKNKERSVAAATEASRRGFLRLAGGATLVAGAAGLGVPAFAQAGRKIKIGYVSPQTGPLAAFGEGDKFVLGGVMDALKAGITIGNATYPVEIIVKD